MLGLWLSSWGDAWGSAASARACQKSMSAVLSILPQIIEGEPAAIPIPLPIQSSSLSHTARRIINYTQHNHNHNGAQTPPRSRCHSRWQQETPPRLQHCPRPCPVCKRHPKDHPQQPSTNPTLSTARDSKPLEVLGTYNPIPQTPVGAEPGARQQKDIKLDVSRAKYWLGVGAQPSDTVWRLLAMVGCGSRASERARIRSAKVANKQHRLVFWNPNTSPLASRPKMRSRLFASLHRNLGVSPMRCARIDSRASCLRRIRRRVRAVGLLLERRARTIPMLRRLLCEKV